MSYAIAKLTDEDRTRVSRAQRSKVSDWEVGRLHALAVSVASSEDREEIARALRFQDGAS